MNRTFYYNAKDNFVVELQENFPEPISQIYTDSMSSCHCNYNSMGGRQKVVHSRTHQCR